MEDYIQHSSGSSVPEEGRLDSNHEGTSLEQKLEEFETSGWKMETGKLFELKVKMYIVAICSIT